MMSSACPNFDLSLRQFNGALMLFRCINLYEIPKFIIFINILNLWLQTKGSPAQPD